MVTTIAREVYKMEKKSPNKFIRALLSGLTLACIGTICIILVLYAKDSTKDTIASIQNQKISQKFESLLPYDATRTDIEFKCYIISDKLIGQNMRLYTANKKDETLGYIMTYATSRGYSNPLILISGFDKNKNVYRTDIQFSLETPGLGDKVDRAHGNFLDMLNGKNLENSTWDVKKFGGDFDYITGSTVTSRAIVLATSDALKVLNKTDIVKLKICSN